VATIGRDKGLLAKAVDALLVDSDPARKEATPRPVRAAKEQVAAADGGRIFTRHGGNVLPVVVSGR
jgi:hypothetical protein